MRRLTLLLAVLALAGCGGPSDEEEVEDALASFGRAIAAEDWQRLCRDVLAADLIAKLRSVNLPCEVALSQGLGGVEAPRLEVLEVRVEGDRASARVRSRAAGERPSTDTVRLVREDGDWRVAELAAPGPPEPGSG